MNAILTMGLKYGWIIVHKKGELHIVHYMWQALRKVTNLLTISICNLYYVKDQQENATFYVSCFDPIAGIKHRCHKNMFFSVTSSITTVSASDWIQLTENIFLFV